MAKFRKKPVVIDAFQWTGENVEDLVVWAAQADLAHRKRKGLPAPSKKGEGIDLPLHVTRVGAIFDLEVTTINGDVSVLINEWVICGVAGEFYPCAADIFAATYEAVE